MIQVRFIVPPSGPLLVSGARVALANALFSGRHGGRMTVRIPGGDQRVTDDLRFLGVTWDAIAAPRDRAAAIETLKTRGRLYPCFESEVELRAKQDRRLRRNQPSIYDRAMLKLTAEQRAAAEAGGKQPHWRFRLSDRTLSWRDMIGGWREVKLPTVSDPVLIDAAGTVQPALAAVLDDVAEGITHVIRADEGAGNTGLYIDLLDALGRDPAEITFAHLPAAADAGRLAIRALRQDGIEAETIVAWLGGAGRFEPRNMAHALDAAALPALNRSVLATRDFAAVRDRLPAGAGEAFWLAIRGHIDLLNEARYWWEVVSGTIFPQVPEDVPTTAAPPPEPWDRETWPAWRAILPPEAEPALRMRVTGEAQGPELAALLPLIGRARVMERLRGV